MASPKSTEKPKSSSGWSSFVGVLVALVVAIAIASGGSMTRVEAGVFTVAHAIFTAKAKLSADPRGMPPQCVAGESLMRVARPPKKVGSHSEEVALTRKAMGSLAALFPPMKCKVSEASVNDVKVFWVVPDKVSNTTGSKTLVYFHGGAYIGGSFASHAPFVCDIATAVGIRAFFVEYTLAPEKEHPGGVLEAVTAYKWLTSEGGVPSTNTVIAGDSAGGGMTLLTIQSLIQSEHALPAAAAVLSPWADLTGKANSFTTKVDEDLLLTPERTINWAKIVLGDRFAEADSPQYSPAFGSFTGFPPLFVSVGTSEILYDDAIAVAKKALSQGVKVELSEAEYMQHVFPMFRHYCSIAETEFQKVVRFVKTSLNA